MSLLGNGFDDPQSNMILGLAQGLLSARGGAGLSAGLGNMQAAQQQALKNKLLDYQMKNYDSEIEARKLAGIKDARQQALVASMFGGGADPSADTATGGQSFSSAPGTQGGAPGATQGGGQGVNLIQLAKQLGIPEQAIQADMVFNGGKKISELLAERSKPNWQNVNGNLVNTNAQGFGGGMQAGMSASADGKVTAWQPDGNGGLVVGAPRGSMETYGAYKGVDAGIKSASTPIKVYNPATGREEYTTESNVVGGQQQGGSMPNRTGNPMLDAVMQTESGGNPNAVSPAGARGLMQVMPGTNTAPGFGVTPARDNSEAERTRVGKDYHGAMMERYQDPALAAIAYNWGPGNTDMWLKGGGDYSKLPKETQSYVSQVLTRNGVNGRGGQSQQAPAPAGNYAAGPSASEVAQSKANETRLVDTAKADVTRDTGRQQAGKLGNQMLTAADRALELLGQGPTASGAGSLRDSAANFVGMSTKGADVASQLDTLSGWLTSNVPRMEGPQSDKDVLNYRVMAGAVGDRTKPISQRLAAAQELKSLQAKYADLNGVPLNSGAAPAATEERQGGATGSWADKPKPVQTFDTRPPAHQFKGKTATSPDGKRYQSDGMIWKEVK